MANECLPWDSSLTVYNNARQCAEQTGCIKCKAFVECAVGSDEITKIVEGLGYKGPYHIINSNSGKHLGPFTTEVDAALARSIDVYGTGWSNGMVLNKVEFDGHIHV